ncbi:MAG: hypothetical protein HY549_11135 [Elusimicrobia bacterium]|nr:hypothetical protein [Elusimicrobiota bacterium]
MEELPPGRRRGPVLLLIMTLLLSAGGVGLYQWSQKDASPVPDLDGFDVESTFSSPAATASAAAGRPSSPSGLGMVSGIKGISFSRTGRTGRVGAGAGNADFAAKLRRNEGRMRELNRRYTARYPVIAQFRRDWLSHPDLKKLRDDYCGPARSADPLAAVCGPGGDHDPLKFMRGLVGSAGFGQMLRKYAGDRTLHAFAMEAIQQAPSELLASGVGLLDDGALKGLADTVVTALGLPAGLLGGGKVDEKQVMDGLLKANPELQKALDQGGGRP